MKLALVGLLAAVALRAADPRIGSWTLCLPAQSTMNPPNKLSVTPLPNAIHVVMSGDTHVDFTAKTDGHESSVHKSAIQRFNRVEFRLKIDKLQTEVKEKKDGVLVATILDRLSPDAKELTITTSGEKSFGSMSASGREAEETPRFADNLFAGEWTQDLSKTRMRQGLAIKIEADGAEGMRFSGEFSWLNLRAVLTARNTI